MLITGTISIPRKIYKTDQTELPAHRCSQLTTRTRRKKHPAPPWGLGAPHRESILAPPHPPPPPRTHRAQLSASIWALLPHINSLLPYERISRCCDCAGLEFFLVPKDYERRKNNGRKLCPRSPGVGTLPNEGCCNTAQHPLELTGEHRLFLGGSRALTSWASLGSARMLEKLAHIVCSKSITLCHYPHHSFLRLLYLHF